MKIIEEKNNKTVGSRTVGSRTVGSMAVDLLKKQDNYVITPNELSAEMLSEYDKNINECLDTHKKVFNSDFFLVVLTKNEKTLKNVLRHYYFGRLSCPTPNYDQIVYSYSKENDSLELLWVIPDRKTCQVMIAQKLLIDKDQWELLSAI